MSIITRKPNTYIFPEWAAENRYIILLCAFVSLVGGVFGAALIHFKITAIGVVTWHIGLFAVLLYFSYYIRATYQKYIDLAWDVYY